MNFGSDSVITPNLNFMKFGVASVNAMYKLGYVSVPKTRVGRPTNISYCLQQGNDIEEATVDRVRETRANSDYI